MKHEDKILHGPPDDTPILPWYDGHYSHAFIALHPFVEVAGLDPQSCEYGSLILEASERPANADFLAWVDGHGEARRLGKELTAEAVDDVIKRFGRTIAWQRICEEVGLGDHRRLNQALRTSIGGLKSEFSDPVAAAQLISYCGDQRIFLPVEGMFAPAMENGFAELFERARLSDMILGDEFGDEQALVPLSALRVRGTWRQEELPLCYPRRLLAPDRSLLVSVHWDSFFTVILGTAERFADTRLSELFEGFWCNEHTSISWSFEPAIALVQ